MDAQFFFAGNWARRKSLTGTASAKASPDASPSTSASPRPSGRISRCPWPNKKTAYLCRRETPPAARAATAPYRGGAREHGGGSRFSLHRDNCKYLVALGNHKSYVVSAERQVPSPGTTTHDQRRGYGFPPFTHSGVNEEFTSHFIGPTSDPIARSMCAKSSFPTSSLGW